MRALFAAGTTITTVLFLIVMGRFFYLQILHGEAFRKSAVQSFLVRERLPARRGRILDAQGKVLADNQPAFFATVTPRKLARGDEAKTLNKLAGIIGLTEDERADLDARLAKARRERHTWDPITIPVPLVGDICPTDGVTLEHLTEPAKRLWCPRCGVTYVPVDHRLKKCPADGRRLRWEGPSQDSPAAHATCPKCGATYVLGTTCPADGQRLQPTEHNMRCPACGRTYSDQAAHLQSVLYTLPGVGLKTSFRRVYPFHYDLAHTLGYMNRVRAEERKAEPGVYGLTDLVGRRGLERTLEKTLRGSAGVALYVRGKGGARASDEDLAAEDLEQRPAEAGHDVYLTVDMRLQLAVRKAFRYYLSGAAVVLDPRTGAILSLYSKPGFDPNEWSGRLSPEVWKRTTENPYTPLIHKAITPYHPGSVYKIVTSAAALDTDTVTAETRFNCPGHLDFGGRRFHCHNRAGHGALDLVGALKHSCDVYFYHVGEMLGIDTLAEYGRRFGFGERTGLALPDRPGIVPTEAFYREKTKTGWQPGFALSTAIGQGALTASPLQVARAFAAIVNGGNVLRLHIVDHETNERGEVVRRVGPEVVQRLGLPASDLALIREGLVRVVNDPDGTAHGAALDSIVLAGKTGTAEAAEWRPGADDDLRRWLREDHAWFACYAPAEDPQVVVVVFVEHGGFGSHMAAPIAVRIIKSWMKLGFYHPPGDEPDAPTSPTAPGEPPGGAP